MSAVAKVAAVVVGAVAIVATGGLGAPIAAAVTGFLGVSAGVISAAATGLGLIASLTAKKPTTSVTGNQTSFSANPDDGLPWLIGRSGTAGKITYRTGFDTRDAGDNDRQAFVSVLSVGPIDAVEGQTVDQVPTNYTPGGAAIGVYSGWMWSRTQLGALPEGAALGFGDGAGTPPGWTAQHKLSGKAAASWTLRFDTKGKMFQGGVPAPLWIARGARCYDPTKDSTYPGGSGPHRIADPTDTAAYDAAMATWEWTENPYLLAMRWAHGIWQRDRSDAGSTYQRVMGIGAPWALIDVPSYVEGRNIAAANGWKAGGVIYSTDGKWDAMKRILQAGMGEPMPLGAKISCLVNAPKVSLATITTDDVVGAASVTATQARRDRLNTITPRYRLEANNWALLPGSPISVPEYVAFDKGKRSRLIDYPYIQSTSQVATAVRYDIENAREFGPIVLPLKLVWMGYKPGDCVTATLPELGLNAQPILLLNRQLSPASGIVTMTARSETAAKHAYALGQTTTPPPTPGVTAQPLVPTPKDGAWTLTALPVGDQLVTPTLAIGGTCEANVDGIVFEYRVFDSSAPWTSAGSDAATATYREITGLRAGTAYEVAVSYTKAGVTGDRRVVGPVTTAVVSVKGDKGDKGNDGVSAYAFLQTNQNIQIPTAADGSVITWNGAKTTVTIFANGGDATPSFVLSVIDNPQGLTTAIVGSTVKITGGLDPSEPNAELMLRMTGSGEYAGVTIDQQVTLTRSRAGADGSSPVLVDLKATPPYVHLNKSGAIDSGPIRFTVARQNTSDVVSFRFEGLDGSGFYQGTAAGLVAYAPSIFSSSGPDDLTITQAWSGDASSPGYGSGFTVRAFIGTYEIGDIVTVIRIRDGADGRDGIDGLPGGAGADGRTSYVHYAYANAPDGSVDFTTGAPGSRAYEGSYTDFTAADSTSPSAYAWREYRGPAFGMSGTNVAIAGSQVIKVAGGNTWNAQAYSTVGYRGGAQCGFRGEGSNTEISMAGLNSDPTTDASYQTLDYAWYLQPDGYAGVRLNGDPINVFAGPGYGEGLFQVDYDNRFVRWLYNGVVYHTLDVGPDKLLYFDSSINRAAGRLKDVDFGPRGARGADGADGLDGTNGTPGRDGTNGSDGADGRTSYVHIAYADSADGSINFTTGAPGGRAFIGTYTDFSEPDSGAYTAYTWSRFRGVDGTDGTPGAPGANGQTTYVHIAYARSADGTADFTAGDPGTRTYIGVRTDFTLADSTNPADYAWSLIKGADGADGEDGAPGAPGADGIGLVVSPPAVLIPSFSGGASRPDWTGGSVTITLNKGGQPIGADSYAVVSSTNVSSIAISGQTVTFSDIVGDSGSFVVRATRAGVSYDQTVKITRAKDGSAAFSSTINFSGGTGSFAIGNTTVPGGRTARLSGGADYTASSPVSGSTGGRGRLTLEWRNATDGGPWNILGYADGSTATTRNLGTPTEPDYDITPGSVSASFTFTSPSPDKNLDFRATFSTSSGQIGNHSGSARLEITA